MGRDLAGRGDAIRIDDRISSLASAAIRLTFEHWPEDSGYVGSLPEVLGVFSQGDTVDDLEQNIREHVVADAREQSQTGAPVKEIEVPARSIAAAAVRPRQNATATPG